ncbi:MAG: FoF1 ATP synthase subunit a [Anaerolineales bacterium]
MTKTTDATPKKKGWRWGTNRWIVLGLIILGAYLLTDFFGIGQNIRPIRPFVQLPAEHWSEHPLFSTSFLGIGDFYLTNTLVALFIVMALVIGLAFWFNRAVRNAFKKNDLALKGIPGALEALLEALFNMTQATAGKWAWTIFPWFATITLTVLLANWMELIPGVDSIGVIEEAHGTGYAVRQLTEGIATITMPEMAEHGSHLIPFVRVVSTDLNFTVALALIAVVAVQVMGVRAQGIQYFTKFWNTKTFFSKPIFGVIDWGVGLLELVSEFSKILSFAFRLFGNIFAGSVLLFVMGSLLGSIVILPSMFYLLEFFVGAIQALVFGLLTMTFMAQATQGHGEHEEAH